LNASMKVDMATKSSAVQVLGASGTPAMPS
jgi:hypothetical protein